MHEKNDAMIRKHANCVMSDVVSVLAIVQTRMVRIRALLGPFLSHVPRVLQDSDQAALRDLLWPVLLKTKDVLVHDSFTCQMFPMSSPWPTQRQDGQFVGSPLLRREWNVTKQCPRKCRPPEHQDWIYC